MASASWSRPAERELRGSHWNVLLSPSGCPSLTTTDLSWLLGRPREGEGTIFNEAAIATTRTSPLARLAAKSASDTRFAARPRASGLVGHPR